MDFGELENEQSISVDALEVNESFDFDKADDFNKTVEHEEIHIDEKLIPEESTEKKKDTNFVLDSDENFIKKQKLSAKIYMTLIDNIFSSIAGYVNPVRSREFFLVPEKEKKDIIDLWAEVLMLEKKAKNPKTLLTSLFAGIYAPMIYIVVADLIKHNKNKKAEKNKNKKETVQPIEVKPIEVTKPLESPIQFNDNKVVEIIEERKKEVPPTENKDKKETRGRVKGKKKSPIDGKYYFPHEKPEHFK